MCCFKINFYKDLWIKHLGGRTGFVWGLRRRNGSPPFLLVFKVEENEYLVIWFVWSVWAVWRVDSHINVAGLHIRLGVPNMGWLVWFTCLRMNRTRLRESCSCLRTSRTCFDGAAHIWGLDERVFGWITHMSDAEPNIIPAELHVFTIDTNLFPVEPNLFSVVLHMLRVYPNLKRYSSTFK